MMPTIAGTHQHAPDSPEMEESEDTLQRVRAALHSGNVGKYELASMFAECEATSDQLSPSERAELLALQVSLGGGSNTLEF